MTKSNDNRVRQSLERTRLKLKSETLQLEKRRRELLGEREAAIVALRVLCERYGDNDWPDELPLVQILESHLADPLADRVAVLVRRLRTLDAQALATQAAPVTPPAAARVATVPTVPQPAPAAPARPHLQAVETTRHSVITIRDQDRATGQIGYRSSCVCRWTSVLEEHKITADRAGGQHVAIARNPTLHSRGATTHA